MVLILTHGGARALCEESRFPQSILDRSMTANSDCRLPLIVVQSDAELRFDRCMSRSVFEAFVVALNDQTETNLEGVVTSRSWLGLLGWLCDRLSNPRSAVETGFSDSADWFDRDDVLGRIVLRVARNTARSVTGC
jgi:hypothetical protein